MTDEVALRECTRKNACYDCDNEQCWYHGKKEADCPKLECDRDDGLQYECDHCGFIDRYIEYERKAHKENT